MPSWNIHTAHVERLLREGGGAEALGVRSANEFLFGNFVPDIYVGYMVHRPTRTIDYKVTHFASGDKIPLPDHDKFWRDYIEGRGRVSDVVIGAWCHLVCDHVYNSQTRRYIASIGVVASDETRIRKQHDFDLFGRTLDISMRPETTSDLVRASAGYPQYAIEERDVRAAVAVAGRIVYQNQLDYITGVPAYDLLTEGFFSEAREKAHEVCLAGMRRYAAGIRSGC